MTFQMALSPEATKEVRSTRNRRGDTQQIFRFFQDEGDEDRSDVTNAFDDRECIPGFSNLPDSFHEFSKGSVVEV